MSKDRLGELSAAGVAVWLDDISRQRLTSGNLEQLRDSDHVVGVTSNPTIFEKALSSGDDYATQLSELALRKVSVDEAARAITTYDIRWACDELRGVYDATGGQDGRVSIEVDPRLAHDTQRTIAEAKALWWQVDRPNLFIKIPATEAGLPAISEVLSEGISVNVTLIFGLERYQKVMEAFFDGLEKAKKNGHDLSVMASVASFFVSRVDTEIDKRLDAAGADPKLKGKAAVANARLAYQAFEQAFDSDRWRALEQAGAKAQRPLWASTGTKDKAYSDVLYVEELIVPGTVNTMPQATMEAFADHGETKPDTVTGNYAHARQVLDDLAAAGIDYDDVIDTLEREGVEKFADSWNDLLATVSTALDKTQESNR
ncbi:transaldolase [Stackebrandtia nassauensis]|uniref:Transaldolase n=1 Tax=Stackebrandtia nassauensis (strain DSM 44728 / CIP 108903 / NRRL B-16338 / NBRC 102104 / LLR-40K-21) TaxID=446470 RepID=D3Q4S4_STANL|nr:transaldolase [Stackebrandtia nassauensis]ADD42104.1 transaldolase [Stackebrandtia nassauensis DSM 44728]